MTVRITAKLYDQFFPKMMSTPTKAANTNTHEKGLYDMAGNTPDEPEPQTWPDAIQKAVEAHQNLMQQMAIIIDKQSDMIENLEYRIRKLEQTGE